MSVTRSCVEQSQVRQEVGEVGGRATVSITPDALLSNLKLVHCEELVHQEKPQRRNMMDLEPQAEESNEPDARSSPAACDCIVVLAPMIVPPWLVAF